jgi:hypothetical protein
MRGVAQRSAGTATFGRRLPRQRRVLFLPAERGRKLAHTQSRTPVLRAATVPHYRRLFAEMGIDRPLRTRHSMVGFEEPLERLVATVNRLQPDVLHGDGTYLELLFRSASARGLLLHRPCVVVYTAEAVLA